MIKDDLFYTEDHEWVLVEDDIATIGITDFAQSELGDLVYVEIDEDVAVKDEPVGTIEAVKTVSDIIAPISGDIIEFNENLENDPDIINEDPYGKGWIVKIRIENGNELSNLLDPDEYAELIGQK